jgi:DNA (cytosine-5)-methyltransferase 1
VKKHKLVSLFSGGGGMDLGLEAAGFETVFATDIDFHSCITLENGKKAAKERGDPFLQSAVIKQIDILQLEPSELMSLANIKPGEVDLLAGGPPCQAFSVFGKRKGTEDPRGQLFLEYLRVLAELKPKSFVFENVFGLLTINGGEIFKEICSSLESPGGNTHYELSVFRLNSADYGVPQYRDRIFIIGSSEGKKIDSIPTICTVTDAFRNLPPLGQKLANHTSRDHSDRIIARYQNLKFGERDSKTRINKLDPQRPSYTIIVGSDKGGGKGHVHPFEPREVSPRESARIQTFPDWWAFSGTSRHPIRQVGNAVPSLLAAMVGREILSTFFAEKKRPLGEIVKLLDQEHLFSEDIHDL